MRTSVKSLYVLQWNLFIMDTLGTRVFGCNIEVFFQGWQCMEASLLGPKSLLLNTVVSLIWRVLYERLHCIVQLCYYSLVAYVTSFHAKFILFTDSVLIEPKALHKLAEGAGGGASLFSLMLRLYSLSRPATMAATSSHVESKLWDKFSSCKPKQQSYIRM